MRIRYTPTVTYDETVILIQTIFSTTVLCMEKGVYPEEDLCERLTDDCFLAALSGPGLAIG